MKTDIDLLSSLAVPTVRTQLFTERLPAAAAAAASVFTSEYVFWPGLINVSPPTLRLQTHQNAK